MPVNIRPAFRVALKERTRSAENDCFVRQERDLVLRERSVRSARTRPGGNMNRRLTLHVLLILATLGPADWRAKASASQPIPQPLIVHEWGTFTSIAGADGRAVEWLPLQAPSDVPCFVDRVRFNVKGWLPATIRMETPVLYFYTSQAMRVSVNIRFRQGLVTEWFPKAAVGPSTADISMLRHRGSSSRISWSDVLIDPAAAPEFPVDNMSSHYYLARQTDASPLESGGQRERFLFYRGLGGFDAPLTAKVAEEGRVVVTNPTGEQVGDVILFENDRRMVDYEHRRAGGDRVVFNQLSGDGEIPAPQAELERILVEHGLYSKEARAMVDTWRDSWFEPGRRIFYVVPRATIDSILPLDVKPAPSSIARVFVGRIELMTPQTPRRFRPPAAATR